MSKRFNLFYGSSYDRGLEYLLFLWPDVLEKFPKAKLHICYGWDLFDRTNLHNPERVMWKEKMVALMGQEGIVHHGRVGKEELKKIRQKCGIWAYPTDFTEINCITALEAQYDGLVPVVVNFKHKNGAGEKIYTALNETVGAGYKVEGHIKEPETLEEFKNKVLELMADKTLWRKESKKAEKFARDFTWDKIATKWLPHFKTKISQPLLTVYTPTIRQGWWNIMANNLAIQTYQNFEWVIVDDFEKDRLKLAKEYGEKYGITVRYLRGKERNVKRLYGLVNANNTGWKAAKGEVLVLLQDFVLMPNYGLESIADFYRKHPRSLYAPVDIYYHSRIEPKVGQEDWYDGETRVLGDIYWKNPRVLYQGLRESNNPFDWEANYGAIPVSALNELNGWWEFMDDGLGHDNTEIALRAMRSGYNLWVDDTNIATCLDHWKPLKGTKQNILNRARKLNPPRFDWLINKMDKGEIPLVRDEKLDDSIKLEYEIPKEVSDDDAAIWVSENQQKIVKSWK